jgi:hypothetical protein
MGATVTECTVEAVVEAAAEAPPPADDLGAGERRRSGSQTEADKIRRQQQVRRKTRLARHALVARRTR